MVVSAFNIYVIFLALSVMFCMCFENVSLWSNINPNILMSLFVESVMFLVLLLV